MSNAVSRVHRNDRRAKRRPRDFAKSGYVLASALCLTLGACNSSGTPSFDLLGPDNPKTIAPTIANVVDHVACEIQTAMVARLGAYPATSGQALSDGDLKKWLNGIADDKGPQKEVRGVWSNLISDNFVASVNLTLQVTNSEGLNPSMNFLTPYSPITTPSGPFNGNFTLAVGGQFDGTQNRTFTLSYLIDLYRLWGTPLTNCDGGPQFGIQGNLGMDEIFVDGVSAIDRTKLYNIYSAPDEAAAAPVLPHGGDLSSQFLMLMAGQPNGGAAKSNTVSFGSEVDFTIVQAMNGGPTVSLHYFSGPGGGGGGGGKGGGSSSGGGGASQGLLGFNRTAVDTLTIQVGATCRKEPGPKDSYWNAVPKCENGNGTLSVQQLQNQNNIEQLRNLLNR